MNSYKKLFNNVIIFAFGTLASNLIYFLMVPLYTYSLSQAEYGTVDLVTTTVAMLMPVISACMYEAVLRFVIDKSNKEVVLANSLTVSFFGYFIFILFYPILSYYNFLNNSLIYLYIILFIQLFNRVFAQYSRGIGATKVFAMSGVITAFFTAFFNILFLFVFNLKLDGYFIATILAYLISTIYLIIVTKSFKGINFSNIDTKNMSSLLKYSVPLIPNYLMWWLINSSSRYFINWFVGIEANGLFGVASRIPALISLISQVFSQAWQLSAFEKFEQKNDGVFYSKVFNFYMGILFITASIITVLLKPTFSLLFSENYFIAWQSVPYLVLGSVFSALSGFVGVAYTASKKTKGVFKTSIYGGIISAVVNIILIPMIGIVGAGISSMISFLAMFLIRYIDTKKTIILKVEWKKAIFTVVILLFQSIILFSNVGLVIELIINFILLLLIIFINKSVLKVIPFLFESFAGYFK